jgi:hypothetical protein
MPSPGVVVVMGLAGVACAALAGSAGAGLGRATNCKRFGKMTAARRKKLPDTAFALPKRRKFPIPDPAHAQNAKARATQALKRNTITEHEYFQIFRRAERVIEACR